MISEDEVEQKRVFGPFQIQEASLLCSFSYQETPDVSSPLQGAENQVRGQIHARQEGWRSPGQIIARIFIYWIYKVFYFYF